uniref:Uncharacterized protein n=1 Tax=Anguilla anguilla TaxID=7936 RepID=A0A0E9USY6_ANGAN
MLLTAVTAAARVVGEFVA